MSPGPSQCVHAPRDGRSLTGDIRLLEAFQSDVLGNSRDVLVYLPPGYDDDQRSPRFPVLYLHDGQNVFDTSTSFAGTEWGVDETAERLVHEGRVAPLIIVAINHAGVAAGRRIRADARHASPCRRAGRRATRGSWSRS